MTKDLIRSLFSMDDEMLTKLINGATKVAKELEKEINVDVNNDEDSESYFHSVAKEYDNGKLVKKHEKEVVNGECTKEENFDATKTVFDEPKEKCNCRLYRGHHLYHRLKDENDTLKKQIEDMTRYIDSLNDKIKELSTENDNLIQIVNNVKNCF